MEKLNLSVFIEKNGTMIKTGTITGNNCSDAHFSYDEEYLLKPENKPISISLPLAKKKFTAEETKNFFDGLLPEGFTRKNIADSIHTDSEDYISILKILGQECLGAIQILDNNVKPLQSAYIELTENEVKALAEEGTKVSSNIVIESHLSLTGASGKTGMYYDEVHKKWYQPIGNAPSNYIVKQSHVRLGSIVVNEQLCLLTAKKLGLDVPESFILKASNNKTDDSNILFATKRFDRYCSRESGLLSGLKIPFRLHQEDFAQALGINSMSKYEKNNEHYVKKMFDLIRSYSANPVEDLQKLWKNFVFNYFIGNTDNHLKNYSFVYDKDLKTMRLAPFYDILSTKIYKKSKNELSLCINGKAYLEDVTRSDFEAEAKTIGLGSKLAMNIYDDISSNFEPALKCSAKELNEIGFTDAVNIAERIILHLDE